MQLEVHRSRLRKKPDPPRISLNSNTGEIRFSKLAVEVFGLHEGQNIAFAEDKDDPGNWYILPGSEGLVMYALPYRGYTIHRVRSLRLAKDILESIGLEGMGTVYLPIDSAITVHGQRALPLLTRDWSLRRGNKE